MEAIEYTLVIILTIEWDDEYLMFAVMPGPESVLKW